MSVGEVAIDSVVDGLVRRQFKNVKAPPVDEVCYLYGGRMASGLPLLDLLSKSFRIVQILHCIDNHYFMAVFKTAVWVSKTVFYLIVCTSRARWSNLIF